jgi:hypothetical protein
MKNFTLKIVVSLGVYACLGIAILFVSQRMATPTYADSISATVEPAAKPEVRCGWFSNPTPGNAWLNDKDGEWLIGAQGGYQAEGDWADFKDNQWVKTNINYGYGCSCMTVTTDKKEKKILTITKATARPLSACKKDKKLKEPKDE